MWVNPHWLTFRVKIGGCLRPTGDDSATSVFIEYERHGESYTLIDTAGVRRRKNVKEAVEKFSIVKTLQAIDQANVVILLMDVVRALSSRTSTCLVNSIEAGRGLVVAINKWDGMEADIRERVKVELERRLQFIDYADVHFISALHGTGGHLCESIHGAYEAATRQLSTPKLTKLLEDIVATHPLPLVRVVESNCGTPISAVTTRRGL